MANGDKPNGIALGWQPLKTSYPYDYHIFRVREDLVRWPDGHVAPYAYVQGVGAVWVVPVTAEGDVVLIRQFRYTMDDWCWEVPAGGFHDFDGSPMDLAEQELAEEVGGAGEDWQYVGSFRPGNGVIDEVGHSTTPLTSSRWTVSGRRWRRRRWRSSRPVCLGRG